LNSDLLLVRYAHRCCYGSYRTERIARKKPATVDCVVKARRVQGIDVLEKNLIGLVARTNVPIQYETKFSSLEERGVTWHTPDACSNTDCVEG
jgi:hypothetical protein